MNSGRSQYIRRFRGAALLLGVALIVATGCARAEPGTAAGDVQRWTSERGESSTNIDTLHPASQESQQSIEGLLLDGLTQEEAVQIAILNNPGLRAAYAEAGIAEADLWQAGIAPNPMLFASARLPRYGSGTNTEFDLTQDVLDILVMPLRKKVSAVRLEQVKLRIANEIVATASLTRSAYVALQGSIAATEGQAQIVHSAASAAELARRQREAGNLSLLDESQHAALHAEAVLALADAEREVVAKREALNRLMGLWGDDTHWETSDTLPMVPDPAPSFSGLESRAIGQRLDLAAAQSEVAAIDHALTLTKRWRWLGGLSFGFNREREIDGQYLQGPNLEIGLPLFDRKQARIAQLEAQRMQAEARVAELAVNIRSEVRESQADILAAYKRARFFREEVLPLQETIVGQMRLFQNGMLRSTYELLQLKREQIDAEGRAIQAREAYWQARIALEHAIGGRLEVATAQSEGAAASPMSSVPEKPVETDHPTDSSEQGAHEHVHGGA